MVDITITVVVIYSVVVLEESPCPRGPIYKSLSLSLDLKFLSFSLSLDHKVLEIVRDYAFCKQSVTYDHVKSINSVAATVPEITVKNGLLAGIRYTDYQ